MHSHKRKLVIASTLSLLAATLLAACGGSSVISAAAMAKCAHASRKPDASLVPHTPALHEVVAKVVQSGWLYQRMSEAEMEKHNPQFELYIFPSSRTAEEAFNIISATPNAREEWASGETFRRGNVIADTQQNPSGTLTAFAETMLNKCVGPGASQSIVRAPEQLIDGHSLSEIKKAEEDGYSFPSTSSEAQTSTSAAPEPAQEPPASEDIPNPGQSPAPREGE